MEPQDIALNFAELHDLPAFFTGAKLQWPQLCTATESEACHIAAELSVWNEFLCQACIQLREDAPGKLCLVFRDYYEFESNGEKQIEKAFILVSCLLKTHRCLVGLHISYGFSDINRFQEHFIFGSSVYHSLKSLQITSLSAPLVLENISVAVRHLAKLEDLKIDLRKLPHGFIEALCSLTRTSSSLKHVSLPRYEMKLWEVELFYASLAENCNLEELCVNTSSLLPGSEHCCVDFARYLASTATLKSLELYSTKYRLSRILAAVVLALSGNHALRSITFTGFFVDMEGARAIKRYLAKNTMVKIFSLKECRWHGKHGPWHATDNSKYDTDNIGVLSGRIRPWISILRKNRTLQCLTLNLSGFSPAECNALFDELVNNSTIQKVTIEDIGLYCSRRGRRLSSPRTNRRSKTIHERPDQLVAECRQLSDLKLMYYEPDDSTWFKMTVPVLTGCRHITTLSLDMRFSFQDGAVSLVATYISQTSVLRDLHLCLPWFLVIVNPNDTTHRLEVLRALEKNSSVRKLTLWENGFNIGEISFLAKIVRSSKVLHTFTLNSFAEQVETFMQHLSPDFYLNQTLVSLQFYATRVRVTRSFFVVRDIVRRNHDLVTCAAHFVIGNRSRQCCEALEAVAHNSALVEKLQEMFSVDEQTAVDSVCKSLHHIRLMVVFMRFTGVIESQLAFCEETSGRLCLQDIDEYSWCCVRRYLRVADVLRSCT
ncbi:hypothetical protein HPB48_023257 [Haemaphysalis longicornis]|uniref:Nlr family card domain protein n=1 Tax=Haemaphysalis longicornis TaxID=44386 RepID=A0A9J6H4U3_HAELO|nr:hypothetical protein HPB48_023257 [Haemaphysalis longicornis]